MSQLDQVMIDLETLGTAHNSAIIQIAAVRFSFDAEETEIIVDRFITPLLRNGQIYQSTVDWWISQGSEIYNEVVTASMKSGISLPEALQELSENLREGDVVWGNGATFDISLLENAYTRNGMKIPWKYSNVGDVRTVVEMCRKIKGVNPKDLPFTGTKHHALADANHQIKYLKRAYQTLKG